jgi:quercetin dioxygenase-like cupin family protein
MTLKNDMQGLPDQPTVTEAIISARSCQPSAGMPAGLELRTFVSEECGATGFSTGTATFAPGACLPYHFHEYSEAVVVVEGRGRFLLEGRMYRLGPRDCVHIPAGIVHRVENDDPEQRFVAHSSFASARPSRTLVDRAFPVEDRGFGFPSETEPETIVRHDSGDIYQLSTNAFFCDLFARRFGSVGICGGYGRFLPGASLPCHIHDFDESITIVKGKAVCLVEGRQYELSGCDTAFIPRGLPHRFINRSDDEMAMIWVYAGSEPDRRIVHAGYCFGDLKWPGASLAQGPES